MTINSKISIIIIILGLCFVATTTTALSYNDFAIEVVDNTIEVSVGFNGSTIEIFGDRQSPDSDVVVMVEGPHKDITIWKKERVMGAWVNCDYITFRDMPIYYAYASTVSSEENARDKRIKNIFEKERIGHEALLASLETKNNTDEEEFRHALLNKKYNQGEYFAEPAKIEFFNDHLFRASFKVPPSAHTGDYKIHSILIENGRIAHKKTEMLKVKQVGLNASIVSLAGRHSIAYAFVVIFLALFSGWFASIVRVRP